MTNTNSVTYPAMPTLRRRHALALLGAAGFALRTAPARAAAVEKSVKLAPGLCELVVSTTTGLVHVASTGPRGATTPRSLAWIRVPWRSAPPSSSARTQLSASA